MRKMLVISIVLVSSFTIACCPSNGPTGSAAAAGPNKLDEAKAKEVLRQVVRKEYPLVLGEVGPFFPEGTKCEVTFTTDGNYKRDGKATFQLGQDGKWYLSYVYVALGVHGPVTPNLEIK
jgi:hypothetical protein